MHDNDDQIYARLTRRAAVAGDKQFHGLMECVDAAVGLGHIHR